MKHFIDLKQEIYRSPRFFKNIIILGVKLVLTNIIRKTICQMCK